MYRSAFPDNVHGQSAKPVKLLAARADNSLPLTINFRSLDDARFAVRQDATVPTSYQFSRWMCPFVHDGYHIHSLPRDNPTLDHNFEGVTTTRA